MTPNIPVRRLHWADPEYSRAFEVLVRSLGEPAAEIEYLRAIARSCSPHGWAYDWGAGSGRITKLLVECFEHVVAIEPSAPQREKLIAHCPGVRVIDGTLSSVTPETRIEMAVISHVFYHVPDYHWSALTYRIARHLSVTGVLVVVMQDSRSGTNRTLAHFGAATYDLIGALRSLFDYHPEFTYTIERLNGHFATNSLEDMLSILRLALCDREAEAFACDVTESDFVEYVRSEFWNESAQTGYCDGNLIAVSIRRNPWFKACE